ncbi:MAG: polyprenyl synthetase family protein [Bacteroidaceae bacterium]|nr:polyprenyl synthetase family protein [Bacteroidaceae bacterium]
MDLQVEIERTIKNHGRVCDVVLWEHLVKIIKSGKKLRPNFVLLLWEQYMPKEDVPQELVNDLVALELIHTSTLIHDDIIDKGLFRRNVSTLNNVYGNEIALLMGNIVKDLALEISSQQSLSILNNASFDVNLGQLWETLARKHETININHYISIVLFKTSKIFSYSADIFSLYSKIPFTVIEKNFIVAMTVMYQIADDLIDSLAVNSKDKSVGQDRKNNVHSFVVTSFDESLHDFAFSDGIEYTKETLFIRKYIDLVKNNYAFQFNLEELSSNNQKSFLIDLCSIMREELIRQNINDNLVKVLSFYFDRIELSISQMQIQ